MNPNYGEFRIVVTKQGLTYKSSYPRTQAFLEIARTSYK